MYVAIRVPYTGNILETKHQLIVPRKYLHITINKTVCAPQPSIDHNVQEVQGFFLDKQFGNYVKSKESADDEERFQKYGALKVAKKDIVNCLKNENR